MHAATREVREHFHDAVVVGTGLGLGRVSRRGDYEDPDGNELVLWQAA